MKKFIVSFLILVIITSGSVNIAFGKASKEQLVKQKKKLASVYRWCVARVTFAYTALGTAALPIIGSIVGEVLGHAYAEEVCNGYTADFAVANGYDRDAYINDYGEPTFR